jgi:DNA polymerase IV
VRFANFSTITRSLTVPQEMDTTSEIYEAVGSLWDRIDPNRPRIRLLGVSVSGLSSGPPKQQLSLASAEARSGLYRSDAAKAVDSIRTRFGDDAVAPATLLDDIE